MQVSGLTDGTRIEISVIAPKQPLGKGAKDVIRPRHSQCRLGLIAAAFHENERFSGSGIATSSIRNTNSGPDTTNRNDLILLVLMALQSSDTQTGSSADEE